MQTYILLANFTDQGMRTSRTRSVGRMPSRTWPRSAAPSSRCCAGPSAVTVIAVFEAPDDESATALSFSASSLGNTRAEILRAFSFEEMSGILAKLV